MPQDGHKVLGEFESNVPNDPRGEGKALKTECMGLQKISYVLENVCRYGTTDVPWY